MVTSNIIQRVVFMKYGNSIGTGFTVDVDEKQYLVSAKHIFEGLSYESTIEIFQKNEWKTLTVAPIFCEDANLDLIAFSYGIQRITPSHSLECGIKESVLGQNVFFLGFPYGLKTNDETGMNNHFPFPFVKGGIISAFDFDKKRFFIDAHNNSGFSGGPVTYVKPGTTDTRVIGVVHGFIPDSQTHENSGIAVAYFIEPIMEAITAFSLKITHA